MEAGEHKAIVVDKIRCTLSLIENGTLIATFPVLVGREPGHKGMEGDDRTPEGCTFVLRLLPDEATVAEGYHKGLHLAYPLPSDAKRGLEEGQIDEETAEDILNAYRTGAIPPQETSLGGYVAIHGGLPEDEPFERGTKGCVVLRNSDMDQVYAFARAGTPVIVLP